MKRILLFAFVLITSVSACKKDDILNKEKSTQNIGSLMLIDPSIAPSVEDGMLAFTDMNHLQNYVAYLDSVINDTTDTTDTVSADIKLANIEAQLSYTSLRSVIYTEWEALNEVGWATVEEIPEDFFIQSLSIRSVYNANKTLKVGNTINKLYSDEIGIAILDVNTENLDRLNALVEGCDEDYVQSYFAFYDNVRVYNLRDLSIDYVGLGQYKITADTSWKASFAISYAHTNYNCNNNPREYIVSSVALGPKDIDLFDLYDNFTHQFDLDVLVDWGDGATITNTLKANIKFDYTVGAQYIEWPTFPTAHQYNSAGSYNIKVYVKRPYHTSWVADMTRTITVPQFACDGWVKRSSPWYWKYSSDGNRAVAGKVSTHQNFFGWGTFEATTKSYKKKNGRFRHRRAERIAAQIVFDTYPQTCTAAPVSNSSATWPYNRKRANAKVWGVITSDANYSVLNSNHKMWYNGEVVNFDIQLTRCD